MLDKDKIFSVLGKVIRESPADQTEIVFTGGIHNLTRYTHSCIHQNVSEQWIKVYIRIAIGKKVGLYILNTMDVERITPVIEQLCQSTRLLSDDPFFSGFPSPGKFKINDTYSDATAAITPGQVVDLLVPVFKRASEKGMDVSGSLSTRCTEVAVLNSNGVGVYQPLTGSTIKIIPVCDGNLGYREESNQDVSRLRVTETAERAIEICDLNRKPEAIPLGKYTVILEPDCISEILEWLSFTSLSPRSFLDGTSFLSGNMGQNLTSSRFTLYDSADEPENRGLSFDFEGVRRQPVTFIESGTARGMVYDTRTGNEAGKESTGHAIFPGEEISCIPMNLCVSPGNSSIDAMIKGCERGIYVNHFHYVNGLLNPHKALMTGMTRYGTFLVRDGRIVHAVKNLRWTQGWLEAFTNISHLTKQRKIVSGWWDTTGGYLVPGMQIEGFNFTGITG